MAHAKKRISYVGITGIGTPAESAALAPFASAHAHRRFMVGVLVSSSSMAGQPDQWPNRYPPPSKIDAIFPDFPNVFNVVHYNTHDPATLSHQLITVANLAGQRLHGFQLNMAWPPPAELEALRRQCPGMQIILQLNREAFEAVKAVPGGVGRRLTQDYTGLFDHALLDLSAGRGEMLEPNWAAQELRKLEASDLNAGLGVAGGLDAETLAIIQPLIQEFPNLSIDAEGRLRDRDDRLDLEKARKYLEKSSDMFSITPKDQPGR